MYAVGRLGSYISRGVYTVSGPFHPFGGAVDIIVVEQPDGSFKSSPWYVRFGKFQGVLKTKEKVVSISVNGVEADFHMYLDHKGEAYFVREVDGEEGESVLCPSSSGDEAEWQSTHVRRPIKSKSYIYDADSYSNSADQVDMTNTEIVPTTNSGRPPLLGLVFGRRSMKQDSAKEVEGDASIGVLRTSSLESAEIAADLLEVKWSTNLASNRSRKDYPGHFSANSIPDDQGEIDMPINDESSQITSSLHDTVETSAGEQMPNCSCSSVESTECSVSEGFAEISCLSSMGHVVETSSAGQSTSEDKPEALSIISTNIVEFNKGNYVHNLNVEDIVSEITSSDSQIPHELEASPSTQFVEEQNCNGIKSDESGSHRVQPFHYSETSGSAVFVLDGSCEKNNDRLYIAAGGHGEVHVHVESLHATSMLLPEDVVAQQDKGADLGLEKPITLKQSITDNISLEPAIGSVEELESGIIDIGSGCINLDDQVQGENNCTEDLHSSLLFIRNSQRPVGDSVSTNAISIPPSESSEESSEDDLFLFSDLDKSKLGKIQHVESIPKDHLNTDSNSSFSKESNKEMIDGELSVISDKFILGSTFSDHKNCVERSSMLSSPISVPPSHWVADGEDGRQAESLPNLWSHVHKFDVFDDFPLSHSLDSDLKSMKWPLLGKDDLSSVKSDSEKHQLVREQEEDTLALEQSDIEDSDYSEKIKHVFANPEVELSLCRHLLHEEMGGDAASQVFNAEKLDIETFTSLGPSIVKDDKLVVRIGGRYFPWDVAAPTILGMVSFRTADIFEQKGMIAVDQVEKSPEVDQFKANVSSGGSWLWPFSFKRSRSRKGLQPALSDARSYYPENTSEHMVKNEKYENMFQPKVMKKIIKELTPSSEQLAALNLKEGRNSVNFTFSTAMLGKQQVDARIYLWKWNTRVVISDVDGTITKSDVLGQFMPLVGKDWSQTGVAHLFSAIKENGYQLLFLSARAISQAYHTRQFLVNLKQDGKALPDGPVVISPDGLFPSLYREVIRRAPHEFKIGCLEDIRALFPSDCHPFYAGFGNRDTDEISYLKVGIPRGKIFIINPKGEVAVHRRVDTKSYTSLHALVNGMFPVMTSSEQEDFNSWNFWKLPPPVIDI